MKMKEFIEKNFNGNQAAFARKHDFSDQQVSRAVNGGPLSRNALRRLVDATGGKVTADDILSV